MTLKSENAVLKNENAVQKYEIAVLKKRFAELEKEHRRVFNASREVLVSRTGTHREGSGEGSSVAIVLSDTGLALTNTASEKSV